MSNELSAPRRPSNRWKNHTPYTKTPEYRAYNDAKTRCTNPNVGSWEYYGGRGIQFRFTSFMEFLDEIGPRPSPNHSLDRINSDGHYERGNVRWATKSEQMKNRRMTEAFLLACRTNAPLSANSPLVGRPKKKAA